MFRIEPKLPASAVKTYALLQKSSTHTRAATCAEVSCPAWQSGWTTMVPAGSPQADYIRAKSERAFRETRGMDGLTVFTFPAGQRCFASDTHRVSLQREPFYVVRDGDWRGNPRQTAPVTRTAADWTDDFTEHQAALADVQRRG